MDALMPWGGSVWGASTGREGTHGWERRTVSCLQCSYGSWPWQETLRAMPLCPLTARTARRGDGRMLDHEGYGIIDHFGE